MPFLETLTQDEGSFELGSLQVGTNASMWETCLFFSCEIKGKKDNERKDFSLSL